MRPALVALWAAALAVRAEPPGLLPAEVRGGGRVLVLRRPAACRCPHLQLQILERHGWPCARDDTDGCSWKSVRDRPPGAPPGVPGRYTPWDARRVNVTAIYAGWYRPRCAVCEPAAPAWVEGLDAGSWNVTLVTTPLPGRKLAARVLETHGGPEDAGRDRWFFPWLAAMLTRRTAGGAWDRVEERAFEWPREKGVVFEDLEVGQYQVSISPRHVFNCDGNSDGCRSLLGRVVNVTEPTSPTPHVPTDSINTAFVVLGALAGAAVAATLVGAGWLVAKRYSYLLEAPGLPSRRAACEPRPGPAAPVLLLRRPDPLQPLAAVRLQQLKSHLISHNIQVLSLEGNGLNVLLRHPSPADAMAMETLLHARLVFVANGRASRATSAETPLADSVSASEAGSPARRAAGLAGLFDSLLLHVRNGQLAFQLDRVFVVSLDGPVERELAPLAESRLFRVPADLPLLAEHLQPPPERASRSGSQTELSLLPETDAEV